MQLKGRNTSATLKGTVRSDEQFEYVVAAKKGQWIMVEVVSTPLDAAVFVIEDPQGNDISSRYSWSDTCKQTGDYLIYVSKPADYKTAKFTLTVMVGARPPVLQYTANDAEAVALYAAMRKFINAFRNKDRKAFLASFSRSKPFYQLNPMNIGSRTHFRSAVPYRELAADINKKQGLYWTYLERGENGDMDAFIDHLPDGKMWTRVKGNKFVPPGDSATDLTYVKWRKEGRRWVIDEISYPQA